METEPAVEESAAKVDGSSDQPVGQTGDSEGMAAYS